MASQGEAYDASRTVTGKWQGAGAESRTGGRSSFDDSVTMGVGEWRERTRGNVSKWDR